MNLTLKTNEIILYKYKKINIEAFRVVFSKNLRELPLYSINN